MVWQLGQLVRHRASGERAVIVVLEEHCSTHGSFSVHHLTGDGQGCDMKFVGWYQLDFGFGKDRISVDELLIEAIPDD